MPTTQQEREDERAKIRAEMRELLREGQTERSDFRGFDFVLEMLALSVRAMLNLAETAEGDKDPKKPKD